MKTNIIEWFGLRGVIFDTMEIKGHVFLKISTKGNPPALLEDPRSLTATGVPREFRDVNCSKVHERKLK